MPFKDQDDTSNNYLFYVKEPEAILDATEQITKILDAKYLPTDLDEYCHTQTQLEHDLNEGAEPYHARAFPVPRCHMEALKHEVEHLCEIGVLKQINRLQWIAPTFLVPKKHGTVRFISDFRELNKGIKDRPYPIPHIQDMRGAASN